MWPLLSDWKRNMYIFIISKVAAIVDAMICQDSIPEHFSFTTFLVWFKYSKKIWWYRVRVSWRREQTSHKTEWDQMSMNKLTFWRAIFLSDFPRQGSQHKSRRWSGKSNNLSQTKGTSNKRSSHGDYVGEFLRKVNILNTLVPNY